MVLRQLERRFGPPPSEVQQRVAALFADELLALGEALFDFASMGEVSAWLQMRGEESGEQRTENGVQKLATFLQVLTLVW